LHIEMLSMLEIAQQEIIPSCIRYTNMLSEGVASKKSIGLSVPFETELLKDASALTETLISNTKILKDISAEVPSEPYASALYYRDAVIPAMNNLRSAADSLEKIVGKDYWPFPTYTDLLYNI
ncbi:MAG: glutamine synthetase type III, partial [Clostridia bacterium]|nr:glutamine synthetase type III [Clostridia bacterium]